MVDSKTSPVNYPNQRLVKPTFLSHLSDQNNVKKSPMISVVIPTHNRSQLVKRAITSALAQTYADLELIVVDDASTDDTKETVETFSDPRIHYIRHEVNLHASASRNTGIKYAQGKYLAFLDDDDEWHASKLLVQLKLIEASSPKVGLVYCWLNFVDPDGNVISKRHPTIRGDVFLDVLDMQRLGNISTVLIRQHIAEEIGGFDETLLRGNDGDFIRRVCQTYHVDLVPEVLVTMHIGHAYQRITRSDETGIRNAIFSEEVKLRKFAKILDEYPKRSATIYTSIALHYARLKNWRPFLKYQFKALVKAPFYPRIYLRLLLGIRYLMYSSKR